LRVASAGRRLDLFAVTRAVSVLLVGVATGFFAGPAGAAFPGRNGLIAYTVECCSGSDLTDYETRLVAPDGSRAKRIGGTSSRVVFSPDGSRLLWGDAFGFGLHVQLVDGQHAARRISRTKDYFADWSPDGRKIVFVRSSDDYSAVLRIREDGRGRRLTPGGDPAWSVRDEIAFGNASGGIDVIRPDESKLHSLVALGSEPDWSPDGRRVAFGASGSVWTVRADGTGKRRLRRGSSPSFSPDGHQIVYIGPGGLVRIMGAAGKRSHRLPYRNNTAFDLHDFTFLRPDWQPLPRRRG
jgi:dipeptidyl aminopeptidase/acylaminoacyl peptidase